MAVVIVAIVFLIIMFGCLAVVVEDANREMDYYEEQYYDLSYYGKHFK